MPPAPRVDANTAQPGTILVDKYRIERIIGQGGMGTVMLARHLQLDRLVAIKILRPEAAGNPEIARRFLNEAQAAARLRSEHVCRVHDVGMLGKLDDGTPYMVMEYLEGSDLAGLLRAKGRLEPGVAVDLVLQVCEAIAEAHALGIVHRDVKPSNCFLTRDVGGSTLVKVLDFGISKLPAGEVALTSTQSVLGTPAYMSPEQMRSSKLVDARTDIWALGVVLYELLTGRVPFDADSFSGICIRATVEPLPPLSIPLPRGLADVVARCLEKDTAQRFQTVAELAEALASHAASPEEAWRLVARIQCTLAGDETACSAPTGIAPPRVLERAAGPARTGRLARGTNGRTYRRWTEDHARQVLARVDSEGWSIAALAREQGVSPQTLYRWKRRLRGEDSRSTWSSVEVRSTSPRQTPSFTVQTRNGRSVTVWPGFDGPELARLLAVVEGEEY